MCVNNCGNDAERKPLIPDGDGDAARPFLEDEELLRDEMAGMVRLSVPVIITSVLEMLPSIVTIVLVGRVEDDDDYDDGPSGDAAGSEGGTAATSMQQLHLDAAALAVMLINVTCFATANGEWRKTMRCVRFFTEREENKYDFLSPRRTTRPPTNKRRSAHRDGHALLPGVRGQPNLQNGDLLPHGRGRRFRRVPFQRGPSLARVLHTGSAGATRGGVVAGGRFHPLSVAWRAIPQYIQADTKGVPVKERSGAHADNGHGDQCG